MTLIGLFAVLAAAYAIARFVLLPAAAARVRPGRGDPVRAGGQVAVLSYLSGLLGVAALSAGVFLLVMLVVGAGGGATPEAVADTLTSLSGWRSRLMGITGGWALGAAALLCLGMLLLARKRGRMRVSRVMEEARRRSFEEIRQKAVRGELEPLPDTPLMAKIGERFFAIQSFLSQTEGAQRPPHERKKLEEQLEECREAYVVLDFQRRIEADFSEDEVRLPPPRTVWRHPCLTSSFSRLASVPSRCSRSTCAAPAVCEVAPCSELSSASPSLSCSAFTSSSRSSGPNASSLVRRSSAPNPAFGYRFVAE